MRGRASPSRRASGRVNSPQKVVVEIVYRDAGTIARPEQGTTTVAKGTRPKI